MESTNNSRGLFVEFRKKPPTLEEALEAMEYGEDKARELTEMFLERARRKLEEFDASDPLLRTLLRYSAIHTSGTRRGSVKVSRARTGSSTTPSPSTGVTRVSRRHVVSCSFCSVR